MTLPGEPDIELQLHLLQRDWLSANHIVFGAGEAPATVVDTGYLRHAELTIALVERALGGAPLQRIVNTHLHSDHCGGNQALQAHWRGVHTLVPSPSFDAVLRWDEAQLSYRSTGQRCGRFHAHAALGAGDEIALGPARWQVVGAPGHDPDALMLFEPQTRTLISGDALWEDRLAIVFPEIEGRAGFEAARTTLANIEALAPRRVLPGHGAAFDDVEAALAASRARLAAFEREPAKHLKYAARALAMFHMLEVQEEDRAALQHWLQGTPIFRRLAAALGLSARLAAWAGDLTDGLVGDGLLAEAGGRVQLAPRRPD